jgi:hypothetical protein
MERNLKLFFAAMITAALFTSTAAAQYAPGTGGQGGTLPNYMFSQYTTPGPAMATAGMYPAPHPVPGYVGAAAYTYQPLQPHEMMWQHRRNYYNYYAGPEAFYSNPCNCRGGGGGLNKTTVVWQSGCNHMGQLPGRMVPFSKFQSSLARRYYCIGGNCGGAGGRIQAGSCATGTCGTCESCAGGYGQ